MRDSSGGGSGPAGGRSATVFVPRPGGGRRYAHRRHVRVSDAGPDGVLRLDSLARYLQDVATDDWADAGLSPDENLGRTPHDAKGGRRWTVAGIG